MALLVKWCEQIHVIKYFSWTHSFREWYICIGETVEWLLYPAKRRNGSNQRMIAYLQAAEEVKRSDGSSVGVAEMLERFYFLVLCTLIGKLSGGENAGYIS